MSKEYRDDVPDGTFHHRLTRTVDGEKLGFDWYGGAYIEVYSGQAFSRPRDVINVWEYASDSPRIPRTVEAMARAVDEWIASYGERGPLDLANDVRENWAP